MLSKILTKVPGRIFLIVLVAFTLFPIYMAISASFKPLAQLFSDPLALPNPATIKNYITAWVQGNMGQAFMNSVILSVGTTVGIVVTGAPAAYALGKMKFPGWPFIVAYFFFNNTIPTHVFLPPLYQIFSRLGFVNSLAGMVIIYIARWSPFAILLMRSYFMKVPQELFEAAKVDGASRWQAFWQVVFPVAKPGIVTVALIVTMYSWKQFLLPLTFLNDKAKQPLTVALANFQGQWTAQWGKMMSSSLLAAVPMVLLFAFMHRRFIEGLAGTGLKG